MIRARVGIALPAALAAIVVLAGIATLANVSALAAIREGAALRDEAQITALRDALRVRLDVRLARVPRGQLIARPAPIGGVDTLLVVSALAWPWHRVDVTVQGMQTFAILARAQVPPLPWCAAAVIAGTVTAPAGTLSIAPGSACTDVILSVPRSAIIAFDSAMVATLLVPVSSDTAIVSNGGVPGVWRARHAIDVPAGATVAGILLAPVIRIAAGAVVRGLVLALDTLQVDPSAAVVADELAASAGLSEVAALRPVGRRGVLSPP